MKKLVISIAIMFCMVMNSFAQVKISQEGGIPDPSSMLEVQAADKGFLPPRLTQAQRDAIVNPAEGLMIFCTNCAANNSGAVSIFRNGNWQMLESFCLIQSPAEGSHVPGLNQMVWNWNPAEYAVGYKWNFWDDYASAIDKGTGTSHTETSLDCNSGYYAYIWAYNVCGEHSAVTELYAYTSAQNPASPAAGTHVSFYNGIEWKWNAVPESSGYYWNYTNDLSTAYDMGTYLTYTETGLYCNTSYTCYVWAYGPCGISAPTALTQTSFPCWECGDPFTIYHYAGDVAPITKAVTYGTVTGVAGETDKCWITQNLGADQQATSVSDPTEASGGWYWQYNLKQGYQFYGTTLTPSWTITGINQISNWASYNDPCHIEIGDGFRIPTYTEWDNVKTAGGWTDWNGPWNSPLKLHAAGYLDDYDGWLYLPGSAGTYWSSTWSSETWGWTLDFSSSYCRMYSWEMAYGYSVRCVKD